MCGEAGSMWYSKVSYLTVDRKDSLGKERGKEEQRQEGRKRKARQKPHPGKSSLPQPTSSNQTPPSSSHHLPIAHSLINLQVVTQHMSPQHMSLQGDISYPNHICIIFHQKNFSLRKLSLREVICKCTQSIY
jgi:hypothetical protein